MIVAQAHSDQPNIALAYGEVGISLPSGAKVRKERQWESDTYYISDASGGTILEIYLGNNPGFPVAISGRATTIHINGLIASQILTIESGSISRSVLVRLPKGSPDKFVVLAYENLSEHQRRVADEIVASLKYLGYAW